MRILTLSNLYPPRVVGGYERDCAESARRWAGMGHEVSVLTTRAGAAAGAAGPERVMRRLPGDPVPCRGPRGGPPGLLLWQLASAAEARRALRATAPDVVTVWGAGCIARAGVAAVTGHRAPCLAIAYDEGLLRQVAGLASRPVGGAVDRALRRAYRALPGGRPAAPPQRWVFCSQALRRRHEEVLGPLDAVVIHHGVEVGESPAGARGADGVLRAGALGRLVPDKGFHTLVEAARRLAVAGGPALAVEIRGPQVLPGYARRLEEEAARARSAGADVRVGPPLEPDGVRAWMEGLDVVVAPAEWDEPFALVPLEAMAAGRAVVGTSLGGSAELLVDGENALVVPPADPDALAHALQRLAGDPALARRLGAAGWERVRTRHRREDMRRRLDDELTATAARR